MDSTSQRARVNGTELHYEVQGDGPPVVLLHPFSMDCRCWQPQWTALSSGFQLIRYDARGYGRSAPPREDEPYAHGVDLAGLLDHLGITKVALVGVSMGGQNALDFALRYPDRVGALLLASSSLAGFPYDGEVKGIFAAIADAVRSGGVQAAKDCWLASSIMAAAADDPRSGAAVRSMVEDYSGWHWLHDSPTIPLSPPMMEQIERLDVPTLSLVGERDPRDAKDVHRYIVEHMPRVEGSSMPGAGHFPNLEVPERFNATVCQFLRAHPW